MSDSTKLDLEKRVLQHLNRIYADVLEREHIKQLSSSLLRGLSPGGTHLRAVVRYKFLSIRPSFLFIEIG